MRRNKYVIIVLNGGIGNQMFQYAFAKSISISNNLEVFIDSSLLVKGKTRLNGLGEFNIVEKTVPWYLRASNFWFKETGFIKAKKIIYRILFNIDLFYQTPLDFTVQAKLIKSSPNSIILMGYWQNELYFNNINTTINEVFPFNRDFNWNFSNDYTYISIHIRRGDYVSNNLYNKIYNTLKSDYYINAIKYFQDSEREPIKFLVFYDQLDNSVIELFTEMGINFELIDYKNKSELFDLWLMSRCRHNIIANSTFSWWGAYLNQNISKKIICPGNYFLDNSLNNSHNLYPSSWIMI